MSDTHENCIFCKIINGSIPAEIILETPHACCFKDISPAAPHHYLIIPKQHIENILEFKLKDDTLLNNVFSLINSVVQLKELDKTGFRVVTNTGEDGGQTVQHVHFHLLGGRSLTWPPG